MTIDEQIYEVNVMIRPGAYEFIEELHKYYEIVIFTASLAKYADPLITHLDINKRCNHRLFREHCTYIDGCYIKDLSKMGRTLRNIIILDNSPVSYNFHENNGIPVKSWYDDKEDQELYRLIPMLKNLSGFYDVRTEIPKFVCNNTLIILKMINWVEENYMMISHSENKKEKFNSSINNLTDNESNTYEPNDIKNNLKLAKKSNQSFNPKNLMINKPNININIINGSYNNVGRTEKNSPKNEEDECEYRVVQTEDNININTNPPSRTILSDLKDYSKSNFLNNKFSLIRKKIELSYFKKNNIIKNTNIVKNKSFYNDEQNNPNSYEECMRRVHTTQNEEIQETKTSKFKNTSAITNIVDNKNNHQKNNSNFLNRIKSNLSKPNFTTNLKIKTNYSNFVRNHNTEKLKYSKQTTNNASSNYSINLSKNTETNNKDVIKRIEKSNSIIKNNLRKSIYVNSILSKSGVDPSSLENRLLFNKLSSVKSNLSKSKEKLINLKVSIQENLNTNSIYKHPLISPKFDLIKNKRIFNKAKYNSNFLLYADKKSSKFPNNSKNHNETSDKIDLNSFEIADNNGYLQTDVNISIRDIDLLNINDNDDHINTNVNKSIEIKPYNNIYKLNKSLSKEINSNIPNKKTNIEKLKTGNKFLTNSMDILQRSIKEDLIKMQNNSKNQISLNLKGKITLNKSVKK